MVEKDVGVSRENLRDMAEFYFSDFCVNLGAADGRKSNTQSSQTVILKTRYLELTSRDF